MKEIGGYFELELHLKRPYYPELIALNSGRSCLEYILISNCYTKIYLPYYICDVVLELIQRLNIKYEFYEINIDFKIRNDIILQSDEVLLYVNYFGLMDEYIDALSNQFKNLIIDNAQAFFSKPIKNEMTYYSPRKFFGVSDGGYLKTNNFIDFELEQDTSYQNADYLLARIDAGAAKSYQTFRNNENRISTAGLLKMSKLTTAILSSIDYAFVKQKREENFYFIHSELGVYNQLKCIPTNIQGPMVYPFFYNKTGLREFLISRKIFVAKYWDNLNKICDENNFEYLLATKLVALPIDQRYGLKEMNVIVNLVKSFINC